MLKTANLTLNKADQELYEETHSEVRVAIITYHFFLSSTHYIRLEQKIINSQIFYCFKNQLGDVCYVNPLQYANVVKTVIYWKQFLSYPGTSVDILIEQNLRNHKFQSLNIDKFYFIVNSDGEIIDLMTKLVGGHVEYFYYDSNGQKISVSENKLQTNDKSIIIQHKMYPTRISTLSENKFYAINSEGVRNLLNIQTYGKSEVSFSLHQIPQEKYGQITSLELSYDQLRQDSLILTGKDSELERELTLDQCLKICRKKLPVKLIFVNCPQSKSKHVAAPYFTEKSLTYTYINNNSEIVKFTHEEVEREKYSLEYLTIELDANCQKYDSKKSYSIKTNSGEPKQVFTDVEVLGEEVFSLVYYFIGQNGDKIEVEYDRLDSVDLELPDSVFDGTFDSLEYFKE